MTVSFWGVRGSVPSPGITTVRYGGNTSCVSVELPGHGILVLDAGTGIRVLGKRIAHDRADIFILLSHSHWDHIHGFPFFAPIYQPGRRIFMFPSDSGPTSVCGLCQRERARGETGLTCPLLDQMDGAHFPVRSSLVPSRPQCVAETDVVFLRSHGFAVSRIAMNHPGGGFGYKIAHEGRTALYLTDNELDPPYARATEPEALVEFCRDADVLIHDAQYVEADMPRKRGWGHSVVAQVFDLAVAAGVKHLVLYHHDPDRSDDDLDRIQEQTSSWRAARAPGLACSVAFEGLTIGL